MSDPETIVVVAHPDDEVLWFASVLPRADNVIMAFGPFAEVPDIGPARDAAVADLPFQTSFMRLPEAGTYDSANWAAPTASPFGMTLDWASAEVRAAYETSYGLVRQRLAGLLRPGQVVYSHNPWGEYGHADHVLVFRAVESLRREIGFRHRVSPYVSERSALFARDWRGVVAGRSEAQPVDAGFAASIEAIYHRHRCWTWDANWQWPKEEWFLEMGGEPASHSPGAFQLINVVRRATGS